MSAKSQSNDGGRLILLFVRHGETQDNIDRILQGHRDTNLTEKGLGEAQVLAKNMRGQSVDAVYHSPLKRIVQTIQPILSDRSGDNIPVQADADLKGQFLGKLEGGSYDQVDMNNPRSADGRPGVERFDDFVKRLMEVLARIIGEQAPRVKGQQDRNVVIATHGVAITSIFKDLEATTLGVRGPDAYEVRWTDSDDVSRLVVSQPTKLPMKDGSLDWSKVSGQPFFIEYWGKKEKAIK